MDEESLQICYFCRDDFGLQIESELIREKYKICYFCIGYIKEIRTQINSIQNMKIELYGKSTQVIIDPTQLFEILKQMECSICFRFAICCKSCINEHYFCIYCFGQLFLGKINLRKIQCLQQNCYQEISHYIIVMFMKQDQFKTWNALRYNLFCPKQNCQNVIRIPSVGNLETKIIKIDNEQSKCSTCQIKICNICWTEFKGNYHQHQNKCNSEKFRNELLYNLQQDIGQCPKCKFYSSYSCSIRNQQVQQCQMCGTKFCIFCKTANLQLFFIVKPFHYACNCHENYWQRTTPQQYIVWTLMILLLPLYCIFIAGYYLDNYVKRKVSGINIPNKKVYYYIFFPFILIYWIIYCLFAIFIGIICLMMVLLHKMFGIWEESNNYQNTFYDE